MAKVPSIKLSALPHEDYLITQIEFGKRFRQDYAGLDKLKASILDNTLIHPIAVCRNPESSDYPVRLVAGGRRFTALKQLIASGDLADSITCRVMDAMDELTLRTLELMENTQRSDMTFYEDAKLKEEITRLEQQKHGPKLTRKADDPGHSMTDTAKLLNVSPSQIHSDSKLLKQMEALDGMVDWTKHTTRSDVKKVIKHVEKQAQRKVGAVAARKVIGDSPDAKLQMLSNSYRIDDCTKGMKAIGSSTQDFIEVDPPYAIDLHKNKRDMKANYDSYNEIPVDDYIPLMRKMFDECWRVMKPNSWMICWYAPEPWGEVIRYLIEGGSAKSARALYDNLTFNQQSELPHPFQCKLDSSRFKTHRMVGIWAKDRGQTQQPMTRFGNSYEMFYYVRKGNPEFNKPGMGNLFTYPGVNPQQKVHPTERPAALIAELLDIFVPAGSYVTVPFAGSGRTLLEAAKMDMIPIGFDLSQNYKDSYIIQLNKEIG